MSSRAPSTCTDAPPSIKNEGEGAQARHAQTRHVIFNLSHPFIRTDGHTTPKPTPVRVSFLNSHPEGSPLAFFGAFFGWYVCVCFFGALVRASIRLTEAEGSTCVGCLCAKSQKKRVRIEKGEGSPISCVVGSARCLDCCCA